VNVEALGDSLCDFGVRDDLDLWREGLTGKGKTRGSSAVLLILAL
jgi:hypothetical protein